MRWYKKLGIIVIVLLVLLLFLFFGFKIEHIEVEGTKIYTEEEIEKSVFNRKYSDNEIIFAIYNKIYGINKLPYVEDIEVTYKNRNTVVLHVYDKTISGCIKYMGQYIFFDKDGKVLQSQKNTREGVPIVTGIKFGTFSVGKKFDVKDDSLFSAIMNLSQLINHYDITADRIHFDEQMITLYSGKISVTLARKKRYDDEMSALASVLETAQKNKLEGTIDMRKFKLGDKISLYKK